MGVVAPSRRTTGGISFRLEDIGMGKLRSWALISIGALGVSTVLAACSTERREDAPVASRVPLGKRATQSLQNAFPQAKVDSGIGRPTRLYGTALATGTTHSDSAERFRSAHAASLGIPLNEL